MNEPGRPKTVKVTQDQRVMPRSFGLTLRMLREKCLDLSIDDMKELLRDDEVRRLSGFVEPDGKPNVHAYERGTSNIPFAWLHRYGVATGTSTGVIHKISGFFANFRDVLKFRRAGDESSVTRLLEENDAVAHGLISLASFVIELNEAVRRGDVALADKLGDIDITEETYEGSTKRHHEIRAAEDRHIELLFELLSSYHSGTGPQRSPAEGWTNLSARWKRRRRAVTESKS